MKRILILAANIFQIPVIDKAREMGLHVGIVDISPDSLAFSYADESFACSIKDKDAVLAVAKTFCPDAITCGASDAGVLTAAYVCKELGLPGLPEAVALKATDKFEMIKAFEEHGVAHPGYQIVKKGTHVTINEGLQYPLIVKPIDSAGSRGIELIANESELDDKIGYSSGAGISGDVLLEEYMDGPEVSVEVLVIDGEPHVLQITDKLTTGAPLFIETGHSQPSALPEDIKCEVRALASKAALSVGLKNSAAHVEIKITKNGSKMVELGARMGADYITSHLIDTSVCGINMMQAVIELALGRKPDLSHYDNSGVCVSMRSIMPSIGTITEICGVDEAFKLNGVRNIILNAKVGDKYINANSNSGRIGYVIATGETTEQSLATCKNAIELIKITYA